MQYDVVFMNPPYQAQVKRDSADGGSGTGSTLYDKFICKAFQLLVKSGFLCAVHPSKWRKPEDKLFREFQQRCLFYLSIANKQTGKKVFSTTTRFDWYVLQNLDKRHKTLILDENGNDGEYDLKDWPFIPNFSFDILEKILAKPGEKTCPVLYLGGAYDKRRPHMSDNQTDTHIYPCVNSTCKSGVRCYYSNTQSKGLFGIPKIIFGEADTIQNSIVDFDGEYAMTPCAIAVQIDSKHEGEQIKMALESQRFNDFLKACRWSNFRIEWRMFKYFRHDFWKEFIN